MDAAAAAADLCEGGAFFFESLARAGATAMASIETVAMTTGSIVFLFAFMGNLLKTT
jgi:hypothetical protein